VTLHHLIPSGPALLQRPGQHLARDDDSPLLRRPAPAEGPAGGGGREAQAAIQANQEAEETAEEAAQAEDLIKNEAVERVIDDFACVSIYAKCVCNKSIDRNGKMPTFLASKFVIDLALTLKNFFPSPSLLISFG